MKRKLLSLFLTFAMLASLFVFPAAAVETTGNWYDEAMNTWVDRGILKGDADGNLNPTANITRAELATMMDRIMGYQVKASNSFTDVDASAWYADAILKANAAGVLQGDGSTARPNDPITRQESMVLLARVMKLSGESGSVSFSDQSQIASWALDAVKSMAAKGYVQGSNGMINPTANITRAEMATMLNNIFTGYFDKAGTYTTTVTGSAVINTGDVTLSNMKVTGDLIIAEGVGAGHIILDGVTVSGKLIVRGGGENSIIIKGNSDIANVVVVRQDGKVRVSVEGGASVSVIVVDDGSDAVKIEGTVGTVTLAGGTDVEITGKVTTVNVTADGATLDVAKGATVTTVAVEGSTAKVNVAGTVTTVNVTEKAANTTISTESGAKINTVTTAGAATTVQGTGAVTTVTAVQGATGTTVNTAGTKVENNSSDPVKAGDKEIASGSSGSTSGGTSGGGGGGSDRPSYPQNVTGLAVPSCDDVKVDSQQRTSANAYTVKLSGSVDTYANSATDADKALFGDTLNGNYAVVTLKDILPATGDVNVKQTNPALAVYGEDFKVTTGEGQNAVVTYIKDKNYTAADLTNADESRDRDISFLVRPGTDTITIVVTPGTVTPGTPAEGDTAATEDTFTARGAVTTYTITCDLAKQTTVESAEALTAALADAADTDIINIKGNIGTKDNTNSYDAYTVDKAVTIKSAKDESGAYTGKVFGSFIVTAEGVTFDTVSIENYYFNANNPCKNGINAYADSLTVKNSSFTGTAVTDYEPNGIVIFPKTAAGTYEITGNTFTGYNGKTTNANMYVSSAIMIAEGYDMSNKTFFFATGSVPSAGATKSATLTTKPDADVLAGENTFTTCALGYLRQDGFETGSSTNADGSNGQTTQYAIACNSDGLDHALKYVRADNPATVIVQGTIGGTESYGVYTVSNPTTIKGFDGNSKVYGSFIVNPDASGTVFEGLSIENKYVEGNDSPSKNGINAYTKELTVRDCTFKATTPVSGYEPNGIVIWPNDAAGVYTITGNTFDSYQYKTTNGYYFSAGILVAEEYPMQYKPFFDGITTQSTTTKSIALNTKPDEGILAGNNTFTNCAYGYLRQDGYDWSKNDVNQTTRYAIVCNYDALDNAVTYTRENSPSAIVLDGDITIPADETLTIPADATITGGILTGTVAGSGNTTSAKLVIAANTSYNNMAAGTYTWTDDGWGEPVTTPDNNTP